MNFERTDPYGFKRQMRALGVSQDAAASLLSEKTPRRPWNQKRVQRLVSGDHASPPAAEINMLRHVLEAEAKKQGVDLAMVSELTRTFEHEARGRPGAGRGEASPLTHTPAPAALIPVYGAADQDGRIAIDDAHIVDEVQRLPAQGLRAKAYAVEIPDEFMSPRYEPGERAFVLPGRAPKPGEDALFVFSDGGARVMRYEGRKSGFVFGRTFTPDKQERFASGQIGELSAIVRA